MPVLIRVVQPAEQAANHADGPSLGLECRASTHWASPSPAASSDRGCTLGWRTLGSWLHPELVACIVYGSTPEWAASSDNLFSQS